MSEKPLRTLIGCAGTAAALAATVPAKAQWTDPSEPSAAELPSPEAAPGSAGLSEIEGRVQRIVGQPGGLTAEEAGRLAAERSLKARSARADVAGASADVNRVIIGGLPRVDLLAQYTRRAEVDLPALGPATGSLVVTPAGEGPLPADAQLVGLPASIFTFPQVLNQYHLQAAVTVPISEYVFSLSKAYSAARQSKRAAHLNVRAAQLNAANRAKVAYYDWVLAELQSLVADQSLAQARASLERTRVAHGAGRVPRADVAMAESGVASAELLLTRARTQVQLAEQRLRITLRDDATATYAIGENVLERPPSTAEGHSFDELMTQALRNRLELHALQASVESVRQQTRVAEARGIPRLEAFANGYYARPNPFIAPPVDEWRGSWDAGLRLTWSPNDLGASTAEGARFDAEREKLQVQRDELVDGLRQEVLQAQASLREAEAAYGSARKNLEAAEESYRSQRVLYDAGRTTTLELLSAETQVLKARIELVNVLVTLRAASAVLDHAVGRDVPAAWRQET